jgi:hypothetical protein
MAKKSAGVLHGVVSGDASSYINELKRADEATRARGASISGQLDKLGRDIARDFTPAKIGKNLLGGLGIGSGAALVMTGVEFFTNKWKESAEFAKEVEERATNIAKAMQELRQVRFEARLSGAEPLDKMVTLNREIARVAQDREQQEALRQKALRGFEFGNNAKGIGVMIREFEGEDFAGGKDKPGMRVRDFTDEMLRRADAAQLKATELEKELVKLGTQAASTADELAAAEKKVAEERAKGDAYQLELTVKQALQRSPNKSVLKDVSIEDEDRARDEALKFREELRRAGEKNLDRLEREASRMRVDEMTSRGLGTGANYEEWNKRNLTVLEKIAEILRQIERKPVNGYSF